MCWSYSIAIRKPFSKADKNSIIIDTFLYRKVARMDTCVRFIIAMNSLNVGLVTCHLARASRQGVGRAL